MANGIDILIRQHFDELAESYPDLRLFEDGPNLWAIRGVLSFSATFNTVTIADSFSVLMEIPHDYPDYPPSVQETGGRIPSDFHQYVDRTLCLGAPVEVVRRFRAEPRLLPFVDTLVVQYLYGYAHLERYGELPFGELSHGSQGIREHYQDKLATQDVQVIMALLKILADGKYRGHLRCPCGSGEIMRKCHGATLLGLQQYHPKVRFLRDAETVLYSMETDELRIFDWKLLPSALSREFNEMARERARQEKCA